MSTGKNLIKESFRHPLSLFHDDDLGEITPKIEVRDDGDHYSVSAELPGVKEEDISITVTDNGLVIEGEKRQEKKDEGKGFYRTEFSYGSFYRMIPLSNDMDTEDVKASFNSGVLEIELKKKESDRKTSGKKIPIGRRSH